MAFSVSTKPALDGTGAAIPGGVVFIDESGLGTGPYIIGKTTVDPNGVNAQLVLANGAAKEDLSSVNGVALGSPSAYGTSPGAVNVPGVNAFITNTVGVSGTVTANAGTGTFTVAGTVAATQSGTWTVAQGTPPWSVSQSGAWTVTANAGTGTFTVGGTITANQGGAWTVTANQGGAPWSQNLTQVNGVALGSPSAYGTSPGAVSVPGVNAFVTNTVAVSGTVTANAGTGTFTVGGTVTANQGGTWTVQQGTPPWSVSQSGAWTVTANAGTGTFTVGGTVAATQSGTWTVAQGTPPWSIQGNSASGAANAGNPVKVGGVFNTTQPTVTTGQTVDGQYTARGAAIVATGVDPFTVGGTVTANAGTGTFTVSGTVTANQGGAPWSQNLTQFGGTNISTGTGASGTGIPRVTVSNDSNILATQSGTWTVQQGTPPWADNITQIAGSAISTAATGVAKVGIVGNAGAAFDAANGATAPANVLSTGGVAQTTLPTAVAAGQSVRTMVDKFGRQVTLPQTTRDNIGRQTTTISTTTETTIVTAGAAGIFNDLMMLIVSNTAASGSDTRIDFRDTTAGTVVFSLMSRGGQQPIGFTIGGVAIPQAAAATNWTAQLATAVTDIRIFAVFAKNQ